MGEGTARTISSNEKKKKKSLREDGRSLKKNKTAEDVKGPTGERDHRE